MSVKRYCFIVLFLIGATLICVRMAGAKDSISGITVVVKGIVNRPIPCVINNGKMISVDFKTVLTDRIQGDYYTKNVDYGLDCSKAEGNMLVISISGSPASFNPDFLDSGVKGLGIKFSSAAKLVRLGENYRFDPSQGNFPLQATLVKNGNTALTAGDFITTATMTIDYL